MGAANNPCTGVCKFDEGLCLSCGRLRSEKKQWKRLSKPQRKAVVARSRERLTELGDRVIPDKKAWKKAKKARRSAPQAAPANTVGGTVVRVPPEEAPASATPEPRPVVDAEAAKKARKAWKKARKHARKAKKAALKARAAEARAHGLPDADRLGRGGTDAAVAQGGDAANASDAPGRHAANE